VVGRISLAASQMGDMIEGLLNLSRTALAVINRQPVDLAALAREIAEQADHRVTFSAPPTLVVNADPTLMRDVLQNLLDNAWKFTARREAPRVELGTFAVAGSAPAYFVRDNGAGFDVAHADRLFGAFQRFHPEDDFPGTGIGLASVHRILTRHGG